MTAPEIPPDARLDAVLARLRAEGTEQAGGSEGPSDSVRGEDDGFRRAEELLREDEAGPGGLRALSSPVRLLGFAGLGALSVAAVTALDPREGTGLYPAARLTAEVGGPFALGIVLAALALRGPHRPRPPRKTVAAVLLLSIGLPLVGALLPPADLTLAAAQSGQGARFFGEVLACLAYGTALAGPPAALWLLLRREERAGPAGRLLALTAAGLFGLAGLTMHCPIQSGDHLLGGHLTVPLLWLGCAWIWSRRRGD